MLTSKGIAGTLLAATSALGVKLIFLSPLTQNVLLPAIVQTSHTGVYPDGQVLRREFTGHPLLDRVLSDLVAFFSAAVDGKDPATQSFGLWFLPQLSVLLVFWWWESGRAKHSPIRVPSVANLLEQLFTVGIISPIFLLGYMLAVSTVPPPTRSPLSRARTLLPAIILGFFVPSALLFFVPMSLDNKQVVAALWQPFPLFISLFHFAFRVLDPAKTRNSVSEKAKALWWVKTSYYACGLLSAISHIAVVVPSYLATNPATTFAHVFIPPNLHHYLPAGAITPAHPIATYRLAIRAFFQYDWLAMSLGSLVFFTWSQSTLRKLGHGMSMSSWVARMSVISLIGGPGAAFAWAAAKREEDIHAAHRAKRL